MKPSIPWKVFWPLWGLWILGNISGFLCSYLKLSMANGVFIGFLGYLIIRYAFHAIKR